MARMFIFCKNRLKKTGKPENRCSFLTYVAKNNQIRVDLVLLLFGGKTEWFLSLLCKNKTKPMFPQEL